MEHHNKRQHLLSPYKVPDPCSGHSRSVLRSHFTDGDAGVLGIARTQLVTSKMPELKLEPPFFSDPKFRFLLMPCSHECPPSKKGHCPTLTSTLNPGL